MFLFRTSGRICPAIRSQIKFFRQLSKSSESQIKIEENVLTQKPIPRRALLYVPGNDERKIEKVQSIDVDCVVLDCEDGVAINKKVRYHSILKSIKTLFLINFILIFDLNSNK
jgi:citrate lyase subunit beta-like protein